jgi:serine protease Do
MTNLRIFASLVVVGMSLALACARIGTRSSSRAGSSASGGSSSVASPSAPPSAGSLPDVVARVMPSVVSISSTRTSREVPPMLPFDDPFFRRFFGPETPRPHEFKQQGLGSGVVVQPDIVLTNNHVVEGADEIRVTAPDKQEFQAQVAGADPKSDLAVLRLSAPAARLSPIAWGDSSSLRLGETVLAIGNPFGVGETVTMGIVSAKGRTDLGILDYENFIQTDAAINPGNSGGALVNVRGELVGINTAILSRSGGYQGIGFAIPSDTAKPIMESLLHGGKVVRGWLGVGIQDITPELARALGLADASGVLVSSVQPGTPAARAGLVRGDVILKVNSESVDATGKLRNLIAAAGANAKVTLELRHEGQLKTVTVNLGEAPANAGVAPSPGSSGGGGSGSFDGVDVSPLTPPLRDQYRIPQQVTGGLVITAVRPGSAAASAGLRPGDVVLEVNRKAVSTVEKFQAAWASARDQALVLVQRGEATLFVAVRK